MRASIDSRLEQHAAIAGARQGSDLLRRLSWGAICLAVLVAGACDGGAADPIGQIALALAPPSGVAIDAIAWTVTSAGGSVLSAGTVDTSDPNASPSIIVNVPVGIGERVNVRATINGGVTCSGASAPFNVPNGQTVAVAVDIICGATGGEASLGSLLISTSVVPGDSCPSLVSYAISSTLATDGSFGVGVAGADADPEDSLAYNWTASSGSFVDPSAQETEYDCDAGGDQWLTVQISDDHSPLPCSLLLRFPSVACP